MMAMWFVFCHQFVEGKMELFYGSLNTAEILNRWYDENKLLNYGAIITFIGVVRDEMTITADKAKLSADRIGERV